MPSAEPPSTPSPSTFAPPASGEASADQLAEVLAVAEELVAAVPPDGWAAPTPCEGWDVRALVDHLVLGNRVFADIVAGRGTLDDARRSAPADLLGDRPLAAYREAAASVVAAFAEPGALGRTVTVPVGTVPGAVALHLRIVEVLVHGWDLARALDRPVAFPAGVVERELAFSRRALADLPPDRTPFGSPRPVADDAPALDRLAACLGRDPARPRRT